MFYFHVPQPKSKQLSTGSRFGMLDIDEIMGNTYGKIAAVDFGIQWACWAVAALLKTEKFYDLAGRIM